MAFNKFKTKDGTVLLDLTKDTVTAEMLKKGITAHDKSGEIIEGALEDPKLQEKTVVKNGDVTPDEGYDGLSKVTVAMEEYNGSVRDEITPSLTLSGGEALTDANGTIIMTKEEL